MPLSKKGSHVCKFQTYRIDNLGSLATPQMGLLNKVEAKILETSPGDTWHVPDPVPIAWFLNPAVNFPISEAWLNVLKLLFPTVCN